ncbi:MAG: prenyltransferase/squalene oxidase repeat-containing protein [bacterium]
MAEREDLAKSVERGIDYLERLQGEDGAWFWNGRPFTLLSCRAIFDLLYWRRNPENATIARAKKWLQDSQLEDGSWDHDTDSTSLAIKALLALGMDRDDVVIQSGMRWLILHENERSVWSYIEADEGRRSNIKERLIELLTRETNPITRIQDIESADERYLCRKVYDDEIIFPEGRDDERVISYLHKKYSVGQIFIEENDSPVVQMAYLLRALGEAEMELRNTGTIDPEIIRGMREELVDKLTQGQNADGGWGYEPGGMSEANPTAIVLSALHSASECLGRAPRAEEDGGTNTQ